MLNNINKINKNLPLIVEECFNASYIDNLFVSLFYKPSFIQNVLSNDLEDVDIIHLQNMIFYYFVNNIRMGNVINTELINEIRNYSVYCGWKNDTNFLELFDVNEYYDFLMNKFEQQKICFKNKEKVLYSNNYLKFNITKNDDIKNLIDEWIETELITYSLDEIPKYISIFLDRKSNSKINDSLIDIKEGICFYKNNIDETQRDTVWSLHSIICFSKADRQHYYSIINENNEWYLYSAEKFPSLVKINIKDESISYKIKKECVFLNYTINNI